MKIDFEVLGDGVVVSHAEIIDGQGDAVSVFEHGRTREEAKANLERAINELIDLRRREE